MFCACAHAPSCDQCGIDSDNERDNVVEKSDKSPVVDMWRQKSQGEQQKTKSHSDLGWIVPENQFCCQHSKFSFETRR